MPNQGFSTALPSYIQPIAIGYFNDGAAVANPGTYTAVMEDDVAKMVSPFTIDPIGGTLSLPIKGVLDPWLPTTGATAAQLLQFGKFEWYG